MKLFTRPGITQFATEFISIESYTVLTDRFWKKARGLKHYEPLARVLKIVDQDKKPTLSIIYEAMDRAKLAIKASRSTGISLIEDGKDNCIDTCMLLVIHLPRTHIC